jgi:DNA-directed RNA polymerase specialized sigma subunit
MAFNLMTVFKNTDLQQFGHTTANIVSLAFKTNKKNGARIARAVLDNGTTLIKTVTASGTVLKQVLRLPEITSIAQRNDVIRDLAKNKITQEQIAAMLDISQSTVSNVLKKK